jgi:hypothetical protein
MQARAFVSFWHEWQAMCCFEVKLFVDFGDHGGPLKRAMVISGSRICTATRLAPGRIVHSLRDPSCDSVQKLPNPALSENNRQISVVRRLF